MLDVFYAYHGGLYCTEGKRRASGGVRKKMKRRKEKKKKKDEKIKDISN